MKFLICLHKGKGLISKLIQWQTRSEYSHASMMMPDGLIIEAREGKGVRALWKQEPKKGEVIDHFWIDATEEQIEKMVTFARSQLGKSYDYTMVLRFISRRQANRSQSEKWFCSEFVFATCMVAGINLLRTTEPWRVSPGLLALSPKLQPFDSNERNVLGYLNAHPVKRVCEQGSAAAPSNP